MVLNGIKWVKSYPIRAAVPICFTGFSKRSRILGINEIKESIDTKWINTVHTTGLFPYFLKISENQ